MWEWGESKISLCYSRGSWASLSLFACEWRNVVCVCVCVCVYTWIVCWWLSQWWLVFVLLEVDATLGDGCGIWERFHSFREVKCFQVSFKILWMGVENFFRLHIISWTSGSLKGGSHSAGSKLLFITTCS